jgi:CRP-like cAMP-binding protein/phosphoribosyl 1,2-cyclic phosphodiesterase
MLALVSELRRDPNGSAESAAARVVPLPRGGTYVTTSIGPVQYGLPPETIKDSMDLGLQVPQVFVVPKQLFDRRRGLSVAETEFPSYYNFFLLKRKALLVVEGDAEQRIRAIFQETLFGPKSEPLDVEFAPDFPLDARPNFAKESEFFRSVPGRKRIEVDDLIDFITIRDGEAELGPGVVVRSSAQGYELFDQGERLAIFAPQVDLPSRVSTVMAPKDPFRGPDFGVTVLGASHGFDPSGKTTGFMLWIGGRALLIDPPTDATEYLRENGVPPKLIDGVILTHCHADHDAGAFQKLLEEAQVTLYTTPHILGSFLRKYSALSGLSEDTLRRTFVFNAVRIGSPVHVRGGELWFRYRLHSIPTIGVEAYYGGQSIAISADTLYEPTRIEQMYELGVLGKARRDELITFPHHQLVLHEAGIPPLHTPVTALQALPDDAKERLLLVHIASKDVPADLTPASVGLEHTVRLDVTPPRFADAIARLDAFAMVDFLRELPLSRARALLQVSREMTLRPGEKILRQGTRGDSFYVIQNGIVSVVRDGQVLKRYTAGDYFGETALILDRPRMADVVAETVVDVLAIDRDDFLTLLRGCDTLQRLKRLARGQAEGTWELINKNSVLSKMSSAQKTQLETFFTPIALARGQRLWAHGDVPARAYLLDSAVCGVEGSDDRPFRAGAFLGDVDALMKRRPTTSSVRTLEGGRAFYLEADELVRFFNDNPGALLSFMGTRSCE